MQDQQSTLAALRNVGIIGSDHTHWGIALPMWFEGREEVSGLRARGDRGAEQSGGLGEFFVELFAAARCKDDGERCEEQRWWSERGVQGNWAGCESCLPANVAGAGRWPRWVQSG